MASLLPNGMQQFFDNEGKPLAGGHVYFYTPGTTTFKNTFQDIAETILNPNPVVLDSAGRAIIYGAGNFRQVLQDSAGNTVWDQETESSGSFDDTIAISAAMQPVVQAATLSSAMTAFGINIAVQPVLAANSLQSSFSLLGTSGGTLGGSLTVNGNLNVTGTINGQSGGGAQTASSLNIDPGSQGLTVAPTGNEGATLASVHIHGTTVSDPSREFLVQLGMDSTKGAPNHGSGNDKVTLYAGMVGHPGTSDIWAFNPLVAMLPGSGSYTAQIIEADLNNLNAHTGDPIPNSDGTVNQNLGGPNGYGISISGASTFRSTGAMLISGSTQQWNRGILIANDCIRQFGIQDVSASPTCYSIVGGHSNGIDTTQASFTGAAMFLGESQTISWQTVNRTQVISDSVQGTNRLIGLGATGVAFACTAYTNGTADLGISASRWNNSYVTTMHYTTLVQDSDPALKTNTTVLSPMLNVLKELNPVSYKWKDEERLGSDIHYGFLAPEVKTVFEKLGLDFGGYSNKDGRQGLNYIELIPVLVKAVQELALLVESK